MPPGGLPEAFLGGGPDSLRQLLLRFAKGRGPFTTAEADERFGLELGALLHELERADLLVRGELRPGGSEREWCDPEVLRRLRRASLAALRREVEPAEQASFGRFLPRGTGSAAERACARRSSRSRVSLCRSRCGRARCCRGASRATSPRRSTPSAPRASSSGSAPASTGWPSTSARTRRSSARPRARRRRRSPEAGKIREALGRSAMFWADLLAATGLEAEAALPALWELVWAGEVTNDAWTPLRAGRRYQAPRVERRPRRFSRTRGAAITSTQGRWSPTGGCSPAAPDRRALAELLLERQGIVTRDGVRGEGIPGGYGAVYSELKDLETIGACRRGYFVEGLGGAQFALPGAVERLRELRADEEPEPLVLAAADPAQPYGAALPWPKRAGARAARVAGAQVVLLGGEAALFVERGGRTLVPLREPDEEWLRPAVAALVDYVRAGGAEAARSRAFRRPAGHRDRDHAAARRGGLPRRSAPRRAAPVIHLISDALRPITGR